MSLLRYCILGIVLCATHASAQKTSEHPTGAAPVVQVQAESPGRRAAAEDDWDGETVLVAMSGLVLALLAGINCRKKPRPMETDDPP